jgi:hypothetical protein
MNEEGRKILKMVESGQITAEEGATLLELVSEPESVPSGQMQRPLPASAGEPGSEWKRARPYWLYMLSVGLIVMVLGGTVVATSYQRGPVGLSTWLCGWLPLLFGLFAVTIAAWARTAHWIHLRVVDRDDRVSLSLPLPLRFSALIIRVVRRVVPRFRNTGIDEAILALCDGLNDSQPITLEVQDEEEGEHVQILVD